jgi:hypothetical protein
MNDDPNASHAPKLFRTSDIYFSSYLSSLDYPLVTTEVAAAGDGGGKKVVFLFNIPETDLPRVKASYFGGTGTVKARKFVDNLRNLKSMCFVVVVLSLMPFGAMCFM